MDSGLPSVSGMRRLFVGIIGVIGLVVGLTLFIGDYVFYLCGSMEPTTACSGTNPEGEIGIILILVSLVTLVYLGLTLGHHPLRGHTKS